MQSRRDEAIVAVLGDLGRSPRMLNHARELMKKGFLVSLIGYDGGNDWKAIFQLMITVDMDVAFRNSLKCKIHLVRQWDFNWITKKFPRLEGLLKLPILILKMMLLSINLLLIFGFLLVKKRRRSPKIMIIQVRL